MGTSLRGAARRILPCSAHRDLRPAIAVYIAHRHRPGEEDAGIGLRVVEGEDKKAGRAGEEVGPALGGVIAHVLEWDAHRDLGLAVAVHIAQRQRVAELAKRLRVGRVQRVEERRGRDVATAPATDGQGHQQRGRQQQQPSRRYASHATVDSIARLRQ